MTIPQGVRRYLGIEAGSQVDFVVDDDAVRLVRRPTEGRGRSSSSRCGRRLPMTTDEIMALTRGESWVLSVGTLVDANVLLDVFTDDPRWGGWSAENLARAFDSGPVVINPLIFAELSVGFDRIEDLDDALPDRIEREDLPWEAAFLAGRRFPSVSPPGRHAPFTIARLLYCCPCRYEWSGPAHS